MVSHLYEFLYVPPELNSVHKNLDKENNSIVSLRYEFLFVLSECAGDFFVSSCYRSIPREYPTYEIFKSKNPKAGDHIP
jgi:hypothetical protein